MKELLFILVLLLSVLLCRSQVQPEAFLKKFPSVPGKSCEMKLHERQEFLDSVYLVTDEIKEMLEQLDQEMEANGPEMEKQAMDRFAQQYGLSNADLQKLQNDENLSEQEQSALINKALQNSMNISLGEVKNLEKMDKEGREAWAQAYSTEIMADTQIDPGKYQDQQLHAKSLSELTILQKHLLDSLGAIESKFDKQFIELYNSNEATAMRDEIKRLEKIRNTMLGSSSDEQIENINIEIRNKKQVYCKNFSPNNIDIIRKYIDETRTSLPAYYRLEKIGVDLIKAQTGVDVKLKGHLALGKVESMGGILAKTFDYNLFTEFDLFQE
jgi:hypothetical protein